MLHEAEREDGVVPAVVRGQIHEVAALERRVHAGATRGLRARAINGSSRSMPVTRYPKTGEEQRGVADSAADVEDPRSPAAGSFRSRSTSGVWYCQCPNQRAASDAVFREVLHPVAGAMASGSLLFRNDDETVRETHRQARQPAPEGVGGQAPARSTGHDLAAERPEVAHEIDRVDELFDVTPGNRLDGTDLPAKGRVRKAARLDESARRGADLVAAEPKRPLRDRRASSAEIEGSAARAMSARSST